MPLGHDGQVHRSPISMLKNFPLWRMAKMARYRRTTSRVLELCGRLKDKGDDDLKSLAQKYHEEAVNGRDLDSLLPEVFALVRETSRRVLNMEHFPVQVVGGIALHEGHMVEMATGEGKTLVATMPAFLNALKDRGVHIVTVNDYLAQRDAEWMGGIYRFLGLAVGVIVHEKKPQERMAAYRASITYGTNKEFGFDFLRDQLRVEEKGWFPFGRRLEELGTKRVQRREFHYAIVDEADSVLIDDARTPLIIAEAPAVDDELADEFQTADEVATQLIEDIDYSYDRAQRKIEWMNAGEQRIQRLLGGRRSLTGHRIDWHESCLRALKAHVLYHRDIEYVVEEGEVLIVDENTGRKMPGRQWQDGIHQAVAAKEALEIKTEHETRAQTTYQIYFNRYDKVAGMTGTIMTAAREIAEIYRTGTLRIPTNRRCIRQRLRDQIFATEGEKWDAVIAQVAQLVEENRAVLIGTRSIETNELLSERLTRAGIEHVVLNARKEPEEAAIVAQAGQPRRVTLATNMAGRGTDIVLQPAVKEAGGLFVLGTERHESRRVDNQLMGRCARQGDPGSAQFYISVEDPLIRRYRPKRSQKLALRHAGTGKPIRGPRIRWFFRWVQHVIERQHRKTRYQLIKAERKRQEYNRQLGTA